MAYSSAMYSNRKRRSGNTGLSLIVGLVLGGIAIFGINSFQKYLAESKKPKFSPLSKTQLLEYLKEASKLSTLSNEGTTTYRVFITQLSNTKAAFANVESAWPENLQPDALDSFKKSHLGYELAANLWDSKIQQADQPREPDKHGWELFHNYAGKLIVEDTYGSDFVVKEWRGYRYLPYDANIPILLTIANTYFDAGRKAILPALEQ